MFVVVLAGFLALGCQSPGMKLNLRATSSAERTQIDGVNVTLHSLDSSVLATRANPTRDTLAPELVTPRTPYLVGPQDVLLVTVWDHPEITLPLGPNRTDSSAGSVVDDDGNLYFPHIGLVPVKGLTVAQIRAALTSKLSRVLQNPQVDVKITSFRSQNVYVGGEVRNPAVYNVTDLPFTLAEAFNRAGGVMPTADCSRLVLTRGNRTYRINFQSLMSSGMRVDQLLLKHGDVLHVPNRQEEPVYMLGELLKTGSLPLANGRMSLAQAIAEAGGLMNTSSSARSVYVIRQAALPDSVDVFHLDARSPTAMVMADRFPLHPRDIVFVDAGTLVRFNRIMSMILPTVTAVSNSAVSVAEVRYLRRD